MFLFGLKMSLGIEDSPLFIFYLSLGKEEAVHDLWMHDVGIWNLKLRRKKKDIEINEWTCLPFTLPIFSGSLNSFNKSLIEEYGK